MRRRTALLAVVTRPSLLYDRLFRTVGQGTYAAAFANSPYISLGVPYGSGFAYNAVTGVLVLRQQVPKHEPRSLADRVCVLVRGREALDAPALRGQPVGGRIEMVGVADLAREAAANVEKIRDTVDGVIELHLFDRGYAGLLLQEDVIQTMKKAKQ